MPLVHLDDVHSSETCIKGHRSSTCKHTDRALFEIKKKGRPVTQCEHCRELRKTKQVHVKCICELKDATIGPPAPTAGKKGGFASLVCQSITGLSSRRSRSSGNNQMMESAAFPFGLPEALEASVALQLLSEGSSDSEHGGMPPCQLCSCLFLVLTES
jgi:hypothetical protein